MYASLQISAKTSFNLQRLSFTDTWIMNTEHTRSTVHSHVPKDKGKDTTASGNVI